MKPDCWKYCGEINTVTLLNSSGYCSTHVSVVVLLTYEMKKSDFEYRTSFIWKELKNGNIWLRISNMKLSDEIPVGEALEERPSRQRHSGAVCVISSETNVSTVRKALLWFYREP